MLPRHSRAALVFFPAAALLAPRPAAAQSTVVAPMPVIGFTSGAYGVTGNAASSVGSPGSGSGSGTPSSYSLGFTFTANGPEFVTSLGYFNNPSFDPVNPFGTVALSPEPSGSYTYASDHEVGLYQVVPGVGGAAEAGLLLGQTTITGASTPNGDFLYNAINPIALVAGNQYVIAGVSGSQDPYIYNVEDDSQTLGGQGDIVDPAITFNESRYTVSDTLAFAGSTDGSVPGFFGPNFQISSTLPASAAPEPSQLAILGLAALGLGTFVLRVRRRQAAAQ